MKIITNINDSFPPRTQSSPCSNSNAQCCNIICFLPFRRQKCKRLIISATWPHFLRFYWFMTCCHEVISARHMDYIFLQFNAEMNQVVYSGRYRVTGAHMGSCAWEVALELQRDLNLLLFCRCGFLSSGESPPHFLLLVFIFSLLSLVIFFVGGGEGLVYILRLFNSLCSLGPGPALKEKGEKIGIG